jgi:hypothetical protein
MDDYFLGYHTVVMAIFCQRHGDCIMAEMVQFFMFMNQELMS